MSNQPQSNGDIVRKKFLASVSETTRKFDALRWKKMREFFQQPSFDVWRILVDIAATRDVTLVPSDMDIRSIEVRTDPEFGNRKIGRIEKKARRGGFSFTCAGHTQKYNSATLNAFEDLLQERIDEILYQVRTTAPTLPTKSAASITARAPSTLS